MMEAEALVALRCPRCGETVEAWIDLLGDPTVGMDAGRVELDLYAHEACELSYLEVATLEALAIEVLSENYPREEGV